ncbi:hypothetical protein RI543_005082 [Arxiozyma heterogenica]|uniref:Flo11 domain-containing protein n=1 Tax=Arxiozyma heterogenica TaxID=278026 RepID=A0AAN8A729_9SACH|nr:hypothetical protein RI543_005082 [Kazachstania heterogenica]
MALKLLIVNNVEGSAKKEADRYVVGDYGIPTGKGLLNHLTECFGTESIDLAAEPFFQLAKAKNLTLDDQSFLKPHLVKKNFLTSLTSAQQEALRVIKIKVCERAASLFLMSLYDDSYQRFMDIFGKNHEIKLREVYDVISNAERGVTNSSFVGRRNQFKQKVKNFNCKKCRGQHKTNDAATTTISTLTTLSGDQPFSNDIVIESGATFTLVSGSSYSFNGNINVKGSLEIIGDLKNELTSLQFGSTTTITNNGNINTENIKSANSVTDFVIAPDHIDNSADKGVRKLNGFTTSPVSLSSPLYRNSTIPSEKTKYTLSNTLVVLTTVFNRVTMTTTYCPEPSATSGTSMTAIIGHSSLESVYTNSKNQQEKTNSLSAVSNATLVISIASTTTGPAFTNNENQPKPRNSRASTTIVAGFTKGTTDIASETGTVVGTVKSRRLETLLTTMVPQVSQYVSEQLFSSSTAVTVSHGGIPSLASYEGKGSTMYMKWSVAHCIGLLLFLYNIQLDPYTSMHGSFVESVIYAQHNYDNNQRQIFSDNDDFESKAISRFLNQGDMKTFKNTFCEPTRHLKNITNILVAATDTNTNVKYCPRNEVINGCPNLNFDFHQDITNVHPTYKMDLESVGYLGGNSYQITVRFYASQNIPLSNLHSLKIIGVQGPKGTIQLWGKNEGVTPPDFNPTDFTATFTVYGDTQKSPCYVWLPPFQIQYEYNYSKQWQENGWGATHFDLMLGCNADNQGNSNADFPLYYWPKGCADSCSASSSPSSRTSTTTSLTARAITTAAPKSSLSPSTTYTTTIADISTPTTFTYTTTVTKSSGSSSPKVVVIAVTTSPSTTYTTTTADISAPTTTTYTTTVVDTNGSSSPEVVVGVITPSPSGPTIYNITKGPVSAPTTTTYTTTVTDNNGSSSTEVVVVVITLAPSTLFTTTTGDVTIPTTTTYTTTVTDSNGSSSPEVVIVVITPSPTGATMYTTTSGPVIAPTTITYSSTFTGSNSSSSTEVVVEVITPSSFNNFITASIFVPKPLYRNSTISDEKTESTLTGTLVDLTTVVNGVTMTTTYCPEPSVTSGTSMTAIIGHSSLESVYTNSKNQQEKTNSLSAVSNATLVISIASTTTGPAFTNNENQPKPRNSRASTTIVAGFTKGTTDIASETGTVVGTVKSRRLETLLTTMVPQVSQYVSEQLFSSSTAVTVSHGGIPSLASYEGKGSTMYMKWSVAHCIGLLLFLNE